MGGYGSGWHRGARQTVDDALTYKVAGLLPYLRPAEQMQAAGHIGTASTGTCTWSRNGRETSRVGFSVAVEQVPGSAETSRLVLVLDYRKRETDVSVRVPLDTTRVFKNSRRYWMRCPSCGRRCGTLHLPGGALRFACRQCHNLTYTSCQESGKYDALYRSLGAQLGTDPTEVKRLLRQGARS